MPSSYTCDLYLVFSEKVFITSFQMKKKNIEFFNRQLSDD